MHPEKSLHLKKEQCIGDKQSKVRITRMTASNALGDKIPMFVIGKSVKPRCFKGIKKKPCRYRSPKKAGGLQISLKNGFVSYTVNSNVKIEK